MELYFGGFGQGKLRYVLKKKPNCFVINGEDLALHEDVLLKEYEYSLNDDNEKKRLVLINHLHILIRNLLKDKRDPDIYIQKLVKQYPGITIISDEIGNGVVPLDRFERDYRECVGRELSKLAEEAESVERVMCGLGMKLK